MPLLAVPTFAEELQGVANFRISILPLDLAFNVLDRTAINHDGDIATFGTYNVIVMLLRIEKLIITARTIERYFLDDPQTLQNSHHAEHGREIRDSPSEARPGLNFIKR